MRKIQFVILQSHINKFNNDLREFPGGLMVRTPCFQRHGAGSIPGQGTKIPKAAQHGQKKKKLFLIKKKRARVHQLTDQSPFTLLLFGGSQPHLQPCEGGQGGHSSW